MRAAHSAFLRRVLFAVALLHVVCASGAVFLCAACACASQSTAHAATRGAPRIRLKGSAHFDVHVARQAGGLAVSGIVLDDAARPLIGTRVGISFAPASNPASPTPLSPASPQACAGGGAEPTLEGVHMLAVTTDEAARFCIRVSLPTDRYLARVEAHGSELVEGATLELPIDLALPTVTLRFNPEPLALSLDDESTSVEAVATTEEEGVTEPATGFTLALSNEAGRRLAQAVTDATGRARFTLDSAALGPPGRGELRVAFGGNAAAGPSVRVAPVERRTRVESGVPRRERTAVADWFAGRWNRLAARGDAAMCASRLHRLNRRNHRSAGRHDNRGSSSREPRRVASFRRLRVARRGRRGDRGSTPGSSLHLERPVVATGQRPRCRAASERAQPVEANTARTCRGARRRLDGARPYSTEATQGAELDASTRTPTGRRRRVARAVRCDLPRMEPDASRTHTTGPSLLALEWPSSGADSIGWTWWWRPPPTRAGGSRCLPSTCGLATTSWPKRRCMPSFETPYRKRASWRLPSSRVGGRFWIGWWPGHGARAHRTLRRQTQPPATCSALRGRMRASRGGRGPSRRPRSGPQSSTTAPRQKWTALHLRTSPRSLIKEKPEAHTDDVDGARPWSL